MKFFLDFFPVAIFVGIYVLSGDPQPIYPAVMALMAGTLVQNIGTKLLTGKFEELHLWTLGITLLFGGMTLFFRTPAFIFWKASVVLWAMACVFLYRQYKLDKNVLQEMFSKAFKEEGELEVPQTIWRNLSHLWIFSYIVIGLVNLYVAYHFSEAFWVQFKLFGLMALNVILLIITVVKIYPFLPLEEPDQASDKQSDDKSKSAKNKPFVTVESAKED